MSDDSRLHELRAEVGRVAATPLSRLIAADPARAGDFALKVGPIYASFARQGYDRDALGALLRVAVPEFQPIGEHPDYKESATVVAFPARNARKI